MKTAELWSSFRSFHGFLCASLLIHAGLLMLPLNPSMKSTDTSPYNSLFAVELLMRDQVSEFPAAAEKKTTSPELPSPAPAAKIKQEPPEASATAQHSQSREATVSLDRLSDADAQYHAYIAHIRSKINAEWRYPSEASAQGLNGIVTVRFSIARNGRLMAMLVKKSSDYRLLDEEALRTIRSAAPFQPFPKEFTIEKLNVLASFEYEFSGR